MAAGLAAFATERVPWTAPGGVFITDGGNIDPRIPATAVSPLSMSLSRHQPAGTQVDASVIEPDPGHSELAGRLHELPMPELLRSWLSAINRYPERWQGRLRDQAPGDQVAAAMQRLDGALPEDLSAFYAFCNGVAPMSTEFPTVLLPVRALARAGMHRPPLSAQCRRLAARTKPDATHGDDEVRLLDSRVLPPVSAPGITALSLDQVDALLALEIPRQARCVTLVIDGSIGLEPGTVLDFDGLNATRYDSLSRWLACYAALLLRPHPDEDVARAS